jgi:hypothetical protein
VLGALAWGRRCAREVVEAVDHRDDLLEEPASARDLAFGVVWVDQQGPAFGGGVGGAAAAVEPAGQVGDRPRLPGDVDGLEALPQGAVDSVQGALGVAQQAVE